MATVVLKFTNDFSDDTTGTITVGPIDATASGLNPTTIKTRVKAWNAQLATDTTKAALMQGKYGGSWQRISEVRATTTNRIYLT